MTPRPTPLPSPAANPHGEIRQRLDAPAHAVTLTDLCALWQRGLITWRLAGLAHLITDAGLPGRIRGAFGEKLMAGASHQALDDRPCPWTPPCAFEPLWRKQGRLSGGYDHASPWLLALDPVHGDLDVTLTLFGFANDWLPAAAEAMTAALAQGVDWRGATGLFVPKIEILGRRLTQTEGVTPPPPAHAYRLDFLSPLALTGADPREKPASLITGLALKIEALARWHDVTLGTAFDRQSLAARARALDYRFSDGDTVTWTRGSRRQDRAIPMRGFVGQLEIGGTDAMFADLGAMLALGATCHIGADAAFGCGRYELGVITLSGGSP